MKYEEYKPSKMTVDLFECALSVVDKDIADSARPFGPGRIDIKIPLLAQISRDLRAFCAYIKESDEQVSNSNKDKKNCSNGDNSSESVARL